MQIEMEPVKTAVVEMLYTDPPTWKPGAGGAVVLVVSVVVPPWATLLYVMVTGEAPVVLSVGVATELAPIGVLMGRLMAIRFGPKTDPPSEIGDPTTVFELVSITETE